MYVYWQTCDGRLRALGYLPIAETFVCHLQRRAAVRYLPRIGIRVDALLAELLCLGDTHRALRRSTLLLEVLELVNLCLECIRTVGYTSFPSRLVHRPGAAGGMARRRTLLLQDLELVNLCLECIRVPVVGRARPFEGFLHFTHAHTLRCNLRFQALAVLAREAPAGWPQFQRSMAPARGLRQAHDIGVGGKRRARLV